MKLFKKKDGAEKAKKAKPEKGAEDGGSSDAKKKKRGGGDGVATLFANHVEKMLLGVAALIALVMIAKGFSARTAIQDKAPNELQDRATKAVRSMNTSTWAEFRSERDSEKEFLKRSKQTLTEVAPEDYSLGSLINPPMVPAKTLRTDPELIAATDLRVVSGFGPLVVDTQSEDSQIERAPDAPVRESVEEAWRKWVTPSGDATRGVYFNAVTGLVPYAQQLANYAPLRTTEGYDPERDQPTYMYWVLTRQEAVAGKKGVTQTISLNTYKKSMKSWRGVADPALDPPEEYVSDVLTCKVPPILLGDLPRYAIHPKIPREPKKKEVEKPKQEDVPAEETPDGGEEEWAPDFLEHDLPAKDETEAVEEKGVENAPPEFLLFRYFDLNVRPGRVYRYSLKLYLEDPNRPPKGTAPNPDQLDQSVAERLATDKRRGYRVTPASKPSDAVAVSSGGRVLVGSVTAPSMATDRGVKYTSGEASAEIMAISFKTDSGASIPAVETAYRGTVANYVKSVWYWPPLKRRAERAENQGFKTDVTVLDVQGGEELGGADLTAPGKLLVMDASGKMSVVDELEDAGAFASNRVPEPEVEKRPSASRDEGRTRRRGTRSEGRGRESRNRRESDASDEGRR